MLDSTRAAGSVAIAPEVLTTIIAPRAVSLLLLAQALPREMSRALSEVVGMPVRAVHVPIEDASAPFDSPGLKGDRKASGAISAR